MRLIDADKFKEYILDGFEQKKDLFDSDEDRDFAKELVIGITEDIDDQPTAYDIDKVISYIDRVANSGLGKSKSLEYIKKYVKAV